MLDRSKDPYRNFRFRVEIDGIQVAGFADVTIADITTEAVEYREGIDAPHPRQLSGLNKFGNISLKKGVTTNMDLYNWRLQIQQKGALNQRKNLSIIVIDEEGNDQARWDIVEAWPTKYDISDLSAKGNDVMIETMEIVHEGITRVS